MRRFDVGGSSTAPPPPPVRNQDPWPREREDEPIPLFDHFDDPRKAAKSLKCRNRAISDSWDDYDNIFFNEWLKVSIETTRFVDPDVIRLLGIRSDLEDMFVELGMGNMATNPQDLYPELVRQFMATVQIYYHNERAKRASDGTLTFFIRGIRYRVPSPCLDSLIYGFQNTELEHTVVPGFEGRSAFWGHIATIFFDSGSALQTDIHHPTLRYFMKVLANTLLCKMEPSKVRVQELTLVYYAVRSLVPLEGMEEPVDDELPNLGAIFAEHLANLKMRPIQSSGAKKETVGSLLTPILKHCGVPLDDAAMDDRIVYMDAAHLTSGQWLKDNRYWSFWDADGLHLVELSLRALTDFDTGLPNIQFHPDPCLLRAPSTMPQCYMVQRPGGPQPDQPEAAVPPFPPMLDMSTRPEGDF